MAITVSIPKEITDYEEKIIFGLSLRKLVVLILAIVISVSSFFILNNIFYFSIDISSTVVMIEIIPLVAIGFVKKEGMAFEKYMALFLKHIFGINYFNYSTELIVDNFVELIDEEGNGKGEFIYEIVQKRSEKREYENSREERNRKEFYEYERTKEKTKRKRKEIRRTIKAAEQEFRAAKRRAKKKL